MSSNPFGPGNPELNPYHHSGGGDIPPVDIPFARLGEEHQSPHYDVISPADRARALFARDTAIDSVPVPLVVPGGEVVQGRETPQRRPRWMRGVPIPLPETPVPEAQLRPMPSKRVIIEKLEEEPSRDTAEASDGQLSSSTRPDEKMIAHGANAGRTLMRIFGWIGGRAVVEATPEMAPEGAKTRPVDSEQPDLKDTREEGLKWARLKSVLGVPGDPEQASSEPKSKPPGGAKLGKVIAKHRDTDFKVALVGTGVTRQVPDLIQAVTQQVDDLGKGKDPDAGRKKTGLSEEMTTYVQGDTTALINETIAVAAPPEKLRAVVESVAAAHTSRRPIRWEPELNPDGSVKEYDDMASATAIRPGDNSALVTASDFADRAELPQERLPGLGRIPRPANFNVEQKPLTSPYKVKFAEILHRGEPTGKHLFLGPEHVFLIAESGAGKSVTLRNIIREGQLDNAERQEAAIKEGRDPNDYDHVGVMVLDCLNEGEFTHRLSAEVAGQQTASGSRMPKQMSTVYHYVPGGPGPGLRANTLRPITNDPAAWRQRLDRGVEVMSARFKKEGDETYINVKDQLFRTTDYSYIENGIDPATGRSEFPPENGMPAFPSNARLLANVQDSIKQHGASGSQWEQDVVGYYRKKIDAMYRGNNGLVLSDVGYDQDNMAVVNCKGIISKDLSRISDAGARQVAVLAELDALRDACVQKNFQETGLFDTEKLLYRVIIDEALIFTNDALGDTVSDLMAYYRHAGVQIIAVKQGGIKESVNFQVQVNTPQKGMLRTTYSPDLAEFAGFSGDTTPKDMQSLAGAEKGIIAFKGPGEDRAILARIPNPENWRHGEATVKGIEDFIHAEGGLEIFDHDERSYSRTFLRKDPLGLDISEWISTSMFYTIAGRAVDEIGGSLQQALEAKMNDPDPKVARAVRCHISEAVINAVNGRGAVQWHASRHNYMEHVAKHAIAMAEGKRLPGWDKPNRDLAMDVGVVNISYNPNLDPEDTNSWMRYRVDIDGSFGAVKDLLNDQMAADPLPDTSIYADALGMAHLALAKNANEQTAQIKQAETAAVTHMTQKIRDVLENNPIRAQQGDEMIQDFGNLVGGRITLPPPEWRDGQLELTSDQERAIREDAFMAVATVIQEVNKEALTKEQLDALQAIVQDLPVLSMTRTIGFNTAKLAIEALEERKRMSAPAVDPDKIEELCGYRVVADKAVDQYDYIVKKLEQQRVDEIMHSKVPYFDRVQAEPLLFDNDTLGSGSTYNNTTAARLALANPTTVMERAQNAQFGLPRERNYKAEALLAETGNMGEWKNTLSRNVLYAGKYIRSGAKARFLVRHTGLAIAAMHKRGKEAAAQAEKIQKRALALQVRQGMGR